MSFNDKFLNLCFKVGKILFSVLLVIAALTVLYFAVTSAVNTCKLNNLKPTYHYDVINQLTIKYASEGIFDNNQIKKSVNNTPQKEKQNEKIKTEVSKFIKAENLPQQAENNILDTIIQIDENKQIAFLNGFIKYYKEFITTFKNKVIEKNIMSENDAEKALLTSQVKLNLFTDAFDGYVNEYNQENLMLETKKEEATSERNGAFLSFIISLSIFILFLFLPILIRIEENTRNN